MGREIFSYYLDVDFPYDMLLQGPPKYGFGHSNDVPVTFGWSNYDLVWKIIYCGTTPDDWIHDLDRVRHCDSNSFRFCKSEDVARLVL